MNQMINEAKLGKKGLETAHFLDVSVVSSSFEEVLETLIRRIGKKSYTKPFFVVTAYSEFFLEMGKNPRFKEAIQNADLVLPDGVSIPAAREFLSLEKGNSLLNGIKIGINILKGKYQNRITGVKMTEMLLRLAKQNRYRVFLLGGWNGVAGDLAAKWRDKGLQIEWDEGFTNIQNALTHPTVNKLVIEKINKFLPDLIFVSFGRFKQELWINQQREKIRGGIIMGVGSTFDELAGKGPWKQPVPEWVEERGLKWLWRVVKDRRHLGRAWNATVNFGWKVYKEKNVADKKLI